MSNFKKEFGNRKIGFLIRKFEERDDRNRLLSTIRDTFRQRGFSIVDASERTLNPETWGNIREFLDNCSFGVVVIDNFSPTTTGFNPNVFLEIGYLLALKKDIFILIQNSLAATLPTDIKPFIYTSFDSQEIESIKLKNEITKWIDNTISYNPGFLSLYIKGEIINIDLISEIKNIIFAISNCNIIDSSKLTQPEEKELSEHCINCPEGVKKIDFKTQTKEMADKFLSDFENGFYSAVPFVQQGVLKATSNAFSIGEKYADGGLHYLFNDDKEALVYCQNEGIEGCKDEELFASNLFKVKKTKKLYEIEIVILPKLGIQGTYLYISNYYIDDNRYCIKICHYSKNGMSIIKPFTAVDILYLVVCGDHPKDNMLKINFDYRTQYLSVVDLHLDKVHYTIERSVPIQLGIAKNVTYFDYISK